MLRGEFIRVDGLVIPNNITTAGAQMLLAAALRDTVPAFWVGLVTGVPSEALRIQDVVEPTIGTNGYGRIQIARSSVGWPGIGLVNNEPYLESDWLIWAATPGNFNQAILRLMLCGYHTAVTGDAYALSGALPAPLIVTPTTLEADRKFKYRIYLR